MSDMPSKDELFAEIQSLHEQLEEAQEILAAIRTGSVDALVVDGLSEKQVYTLRGADHPYRLFIERMNEGAMTITADGFITYANRRFADLIGCPLETVLGSNVREHIPLSERPLFDRLLQSSSGMPSRQELSLTHAEGELIPVQVSAQHLAVQSNHFYCLVVTDLREQLVQEKLKVSEARYRSLVERMPAAMYTIDRDGRITFYNDQAADLWGRRPCIGDTETRFCGSHRLFLPNGTPLPHGKTPMVDAVQDGISFHGQEVIIERPDGSRRHVIVHIDPLRDTKGHIIGAVNLFADITERKQAEHNLREAQARLQRWNVELEQTVNVKTAELVQSQERLRALASELNLAEQRERKRLAAELHDHLQQMLVFGKLTIGQGKRMAGNYPDCENVLKRVDDILSDALTYSRTLVAELSPPVLQHHGLGAGLRWLGDYMKKYGQTVTVLVPESNGLKLPEDQRVLLFQSVRELLINASKHAGTGTATVEMVERADQVRIEVSDNGRGFNLAAADAGTLSGGISSKFGLFTIRERMRALGGSFEVQSRPEQGTTATLVLPLASSAEMKVESSESTGKESSRSALSTQPSGLQKAVTRVLLVDDHIMMRQGLRAVLNAYVDIELVGEAGDGEEAVCLVNQYRPDVVVMDISMPKMNGIDATMQIKLRNPETIIIGLSVNAEGENQEAMKRAGAERLMTKEAAVDQLHGAICDAVRAHAPFMTEQQK